MTEWSWKQILSDGTGKKKMAVAECGDNDESGSHAWVNNQRQKTGGYSSYYFSPLPLHPNPYYSSLLLHPPSPICDLPERHVRPGWWYLWHGTRSFGFVNLSWSPSSTRLRYARKTCKQNLTGCVLILLVSWCTEYIVFIFSLSFFCFVLFLNIQQYALSGSFSSSARHCSQAISRRTGR